MPQEWHYTQNGQQEPTPVSATELKRLAVGGQLQPTDMVWREGMANWVTAATIKDLFPPIRGAELPAPEKGVTPHPDTPGRDGPPPDRPTRPPFRLTDLHPLLVLFLTICTFGIFGLVYSFKVCLDYGAGAAKRQTDTAGRALGRPRHPLWVLLLSFLTAGYYFYYWVYAVMRECSAYTGRDDFSPRVELSLMLIFPPYAIYVAVVRLPELIRRTQALAGVPEPAALGPTLLFLNPCLFCGLPFLGMMYQDALNQVWSSAP